MARIKDFAKDFNLDIKDALELIKRAGLGERQSGANIDASEISVVVNILTISVAVLMTTWTERKL